MRIQKGKSLSKRDREELRKFTAYLELHTKPTQEQPIEGAYAAVYGEFVFEDAEYARECTGKRNDGSDA